jgi:hypothetical protein
MPTIPDAMQLASWSATVQIFQHEVSGTLLSAYLNPMTIMDGRFGGSNTETGTSSEAKRQTQRLLAVDFYGKIFDVARAGGAPNSLIAYCHSSGRTITMTNALGSVLVTATAGLYYFKVLCSGMSSPFESGDLGMVTFYTSARHYAPPPNRVPETIVIPLGKDSDDAVATNSVSFRFRQFSYELTSVKVDCVVAPTGSAITVYGSKNGSTISPTFASIAAGTNIASMPLIVARTPFAIDDILSFSIGAVGSGTAGKGVKVYVEGYRTS